MVTLWRRKGGELPSKCLLLIHSSSCLYFSAWGIFLDIRLLWQTLAQSSQPHSQQTRPDSQDAHHAWLILLGAFVVCSFFRWDVQVPISTHLRLPGFCPKCGLTLRPSGLGSPRLVRKDGASVCLLAYQPVDWRELSPNGLSCHSVPASSVARTALCPGPFLPSPWKRGPRWLGVLLGPGSQPSGLWFGHGQATRLGTYCESQHHLVEVLIPRDSLLYCSKGIFGTGQRKKGGMG